MSFYRFCVCDAIGHVLNKTGTAQMPASSVGTDCVLNTQTLGLQVCLLQEKGKVVCCGGHLYEGAVCVEGVEVIVENSLPNDIQCELTEASLHVY